MEERKINVQLAPGQDHVTLTVLEGPAPKRLDDRAPVKCNIEGTIGAVREYLEKRVDSGQFLQVNCHILVDWEKASISLIFNEKDDYERGKVVGTIQINPKFKEFGINDFSHRWAPRELGLFFKMNRTFFPDRTENMGLVTTLMNFTANVNSTIQRSIKATGDSADCFTQAVDSNLPATFNIRIPVLKGGKNEDLEVETFASISGREVSFVLLSPDAAAVIEDVKATAIDQELKAIREIAPDIAIIEV